MAQRTGKEPEECRGILDTLMIGAEDRTVVRIAFHSFKSEAPQSYAVYPDGIVHHKGSLYLVAWSARHGELRHFKVDRIELRTPSVQTQKPVNHDDIHRSEVFIRAPWL